MLILMRTAFSYFLNPCAFSDLKWHFVHTGMKVIIKKKYIYKMVKVFYDFSLLQLRNTSEYIKNTCLGKPEKISVLSED